MKGFDRHVRQMLRVHPEAAAEHEKLFGKLPLSTQHAIVDRRHQLSQPVMKRYWLFKSEPGVFSIEDLRRSPGRTSCWDGVRNYQARNFLRNRVRAGDGVLFYHSSVEPAGIAGEAVVTRAGYPDPTAFQRGHRHDDAASRRERPTWYAVDVRFVRACGALITRDRLRAVPALGRMLVLRRGIRLSIQPVSPVEWRAILALAEWHPV